MNPMHIKESGGSGNRKVSPVSGSGSSELHKPDNLVFMLEAMEVPSGLCCGMISLATGVRMLERGKPEGRDT